MSSKHCDQNCLWRTARAHGWGLQGGSNRRITNQCWVIDASVAVLLVQLVSVVECGGMEPKGQPHTNLLLVVVSFVSRIM